MKNVLKQLSSLILPITVLILVPAWIEKDWSAKSLPSLLTGILVMIFGLIILCMTVYQFITIGKGTLAPWFPTGKLVVTGLYRYVRNPMILGVLTVLTGESIAVWSLQLLQWMIIFFLINTFYFIIYEEPNLEKRFGKDYLEYKKMVRRWIPRFQPYIPQ